MTSSWPTVPITPLVARLRVRSSRVRATTPNRVATQRQPPVQPGARTRHTLAYMRASAREKLVALTTTMRTPRMPKAPRVSEWAGSACSTTARELSGIPNASETRSDRVPELSGISAATAMMSGKMLVNAWAASVIPRSNGSASCRPPAVLVMTRSTGGGARRRAPSTAARSRPASGVGDVISAGPFRWVAVGCRLCVEDGACGRPPPHPRWARRSLLGDRSVGA